MAILSEKKEHMRQTARVTGKKTKTCPCTPACMGSQISHSKEKLHCFIHKKTIPKGQVPQRTSILKIRFKEKTKPTDLFFPWRFITTIYFTSRWKANLLRWPINPTSDTFFSNPSSDKNKKKNHLWRASERGGSTLPPVQIKELCQERLGILLRVQT